jgi:hypothetical protein
MEIQKPTTDGLEPAVLEDASGHRARWLQRAGRVVYLLFLAWLVAIVLGGLGLTPVPRIPFTRALTISKGPPQLAQMPRPRPASASDLRPARPPAAQQGFAPAAAQGHVQAHGRSTAPGHRTRARGRGRSTTAPGHTKTKPSNRGRSTTAPGHTKTTPPPSLRRAPPGQTREKAPPGRKTKP